MMTKELLLTMVFCFGVVASCNSGAMAGEPMVPSATFDIERSKQEVVIKGESVNCETICITWDDGTSHCVTQCN